MFHRFLSATCWILVPCGFCSDQVTELQIYPESMTLDGPRARQQLVVLGKEANGRVRDLTRVAKLTISDAKVAVANESVLTAVGDGKAMLTVAIDGVSKSIPVAVTKAKADVPVNFTREIEPILTKVGCNSGACHGAQLGRGGFRLSLFGFDPAFDHSQIVQSSEGRRVVLSDPERSIVLLKPSLVMEHGGGERIKQRGREYETIR